MCTCPQSRKSRTATRGVRRVEAMDDLQQRWLLALSAPMVAINPGAGYAEPRFYADRQFIDLRDAWGIENREQLFDILRRMSDGGHARDLNDAYWQAQRLLPSQWQQLLHGLTEGERANYHFAAQTLGECGPGGIRAWDLGRMGFLLRIGLVNDWIDETESLWLQGRLAVRARRYYGDWPSYLAGFQIGRAYWKCLGNAVAERALYLTRMGSDPAMLTMQRELDLHFSAPLRELPWELALELPEKPHSLGEFAWS